ncbi:MAG: metallophosphoesterase [Deltaproteobacteria bacterium]|nr:metallophosphoesterase [Deltaproteobacteria bacterium]
MTVESFLTDLAARLGLSEGVGTVVGLVGPDRFDPEAVAAMIADHLSARGRDAFVAPVADDTGPEQWLSLSEEANGFPLVVPIRPSNDLAMRALAPGWNAKRELLKQLTGPLLLVLSARTEQGVRAMAPDLVTWVSTWYEVPADELAEVPRPRAISVGLDINVVPAPELIRFLHLSDLHLRPKASNKYDQARTLDGLIEMVKQRRNDDRLDLIFVSGDLAYSGSSAEYEEVKSFLNRLLTATGLDSTKLFMVPGNHDVDRGCGRWLRRTLDEDTKRDFFLEPHNQRFHLEKLAGYRDFARNFGARPFGLGTGANAVELVEVRGRRLGIASLNSAWFAQGEDDHENLWLGEPNLKAAVDRLAEADVDLAIALFHHPTEDLADRYEAENILERHFELVLRGHLHKDKIRASITPRGGYLEVAAPAAYQGSQWPNGCFTGEIDFSVNQLRLTAWRFGEAGDAWVPDATVFPSSSADGYRGVFALKPRTRSEGGWLLELRDELAAIFLGLSAADREPFKSLTEAPSDDARAQWSVLSRDPQRLRDAWDSLARRSREFRGRFAPRIGRALFSKVPARKEESTTPFESPFEFLQQFARYWRLASTKWISELRDPEFATAAAIFACARRWAFRRWDPPQPNRPRLWFVDLRFDEPIRGEWLAQIDRLGDGNAVLILIDKATVAMGRQVEAEEVHLFPEGPPVLVLRT